MGFRAVLFRMVPKLIFKIWNATKGFRAVLFRMVPKLLFLHFLGVRCFRAVLFRMVPKPVKYYKDGLAKVNLTNGQTLRGKGNVPAKPVIEIRGNGTMTLIINGRKTKLKDIQSAITLDMAANQVYSGNLPAWDKMVRAPEYQKPFLDAGPNKISWDGNFQVSIIPNWGVKI